MNLTVISDVHLNRFHSYNLTDFNFRDNQFLRAANRVIEIAKSNESKILCILGDLIDTPILTPNAVHLLMKFVGILNEYFDKVYFITGQHDESSKLRDWKEEDSLVTLLPRFSSKFEYMNGKIIDFDGCKVYFHDFMCETSKIDDVPNCDMFFGHVTLSNMYGQTIDPQPYKLGLFGDIHSIVDMGKNHSVGGFLQKNLSDAPFGQVCIVDTNTCTFKRIQLINKDNKFLRIYKDTAGNDPIDEYTVIRKVSSGKKIVESIQLKSGDDVDSTSFADLNKIINDRLQKNDLLDIHRDILAECKIKDPLNLDFKLTHVKIKNFRSISELELDLNKYSGITFISGQNGSGKSSLVNAIYNGMVGNKFIRRNTKLGQSNLSVDVTLEYEGHKYRIIRGNGTCEFFVDDNRVSKNSKTALEAHIAETLPFLHYLHVFYMNSSGDYYNKIFDSKIINRLFGIDNFIQFYEKAAAKAKKISNTISANRMTLSNYNGRLEVLEKLIEDQTKERTNLETGFIELTPDEVNLMNKIIKLRTALSSNEANLKKYEDSLPISIDEYNSLLSSKDELNELQAFNREVEHKKSLLQDAKSELEKLNSSKKEMTCPKCNETFEIKVDVIESRKKDLVSKIAQLEDYLSKNAIKDTTEVSNRVKRLKELEGLKSQYDAKLALVKLIEETRTELNNLDTPYLNKDNNELNTIITENRITANKIKDLNKSISDKVNEKNATEAEMSSLADVIDSDSKLLAKFKLYADLFSEGNERSIHKEVLVKISEKLSDDKISFLSSEDSDDLGLRLLVDGTWIDYSRCSTGQKVRMNLMILSKMVSLVEKCGLIVLDEATSNVDVQALPNCIELIRNLAMNCSNIFVISHNSILTNDYDNHLSCELVNGCSIYS